VDIKGKKVSKLYAAALKEVFKKHYNEGNVIRKVNHDRFTLCSSRKVMFQPFWKRQPLLFGWTDSKDRRENVWMLVSSICIPSLYELAPAASCTHGQVETLVFDLLVDVDVEKRTRAGVDLW